MRTDRRRLRLSGEIFGRVVIPFHHVAYAYVVECRRILLLTFQFFQSGFVVSFDHVPHSPVDPRNPDVFRTVRVNPRGAAVLVRNRRSDGSRPVDVVVDLQISGIPQGRIKFFSM